MSTINTNGINVNYPVPGQNNSSQGFRDNFAAIKTNLGIAGNELSDLQNKVVLKSALANLTLNNDMANTLISNASTRSFRATTYNLGNALAGTVMIDASLADVQYGTVDEDIVLQFGKWSPAGTEQAIELHLAIANANATISFPTTVVSSNNNYGGTVLENYQDISNVMTITAPYNVTQLNYKLSTTDCGNTIYIEPINRPFKTTQLTERTPPTTGFLGDTFATVCVDNNYLYIATGNYDATEIGPVEVIATTAVSNLITVSSIVSMVVGAPVVFTGDTFGGLIAGQVYYIHSFGPGQTLRVSTTVGGDAVVLSTVIPPNPNCNLTSYNGTDIWKFAYLSPLGTGDLSIVGHIIHSTNTTIAANALTQTDATLLTKDINIVLTADASNTGVKLPVAVAGYKIIIKNDTAQILNVYPNTGAIIGSLTINTPGTLAVGASLEYICSQSAIAGTGGKWFNVNSSYA
jgi:hypothetical protein